jgi:hypothetical protein
MSARYSCAEPTFLDRAKNIMSSVVDEIPEAKFGIIAFDRLAFPITHITSDRNYLEQVIEYGVNVALTYDATATNISNALSVIANKKIRLPDIYKDISYVIMLSDGHVEGNYQNRFRLPFQELQEANIKIITVGVGNVGETPIPILTDSGVCRRDLYTDLQGNTIYIPLRDDILTFIASGTGGEYFGEGEAEQLIRYMRNNGLKVADNEEITLNQHRDISLHILLLTGVSLIGMAIMSKIQIIK